MGEKEMRQMIEGFVAAYNDFDVAGMTRHLHPDIEFRNISGGETTHATTGIAAFTQQAQAATQYFSERQQQITGITFQDNTATVFIDYSATLAVDLPDGLKAGDKINLQGKSVFSFADHKIIRLEDYS
jgi:ketosteroid isomerase-like protein